VIHEPTVDPNFLILAARNPAELEQKRKSDAARTLTDRKTALEAYVADAKQLTGRSSFEQNLASFLQEKADANQVLYDIYQGKSDRADAFFEASDRAWSKAVPDLFKTLEDSMKGPYALGDQVVSVRL
jgi:hypothetical protein